VRRTPRRRGIRQGSLRPRDRLGRQIGFRQPKGRGQSGISEVRHEAVTLWPTRYPLLSACLRDEWYYDSEARALGQQSNDVTTKHSLGHLATTCWRHSPAARPKLPLAQEVRSSDIAPPAPLQLILPASVRVTKSKCSQFESVLTRADPHHRSRRHTCSRYPFGCGSVLAPRTTPTSIIRAGRCHTKSTDPAMPNTRRTPGTIRPRQ